MINTTVDHLVRYFFLKDEQKFLRIDRLDSNRSYELHLKVNSHAGDSRRVIAFRTVANQEDLTMHKNDSILLLIIIVGTFFLVFLFCLLTMIFSQYVRLYCKKWNQTATRPEKARTDSFVSGK